MSIVLYTGKPGAGKTYRVVHELLRDAGRYYVFHNIDGLKESMIEEGRFIQSWVDIANFMTRKKQEEICEWVRREHNRSVLVIIDEAQMFMSDRNNEIKAWLSWHRHLGQDIKLVCQHYKMINSDLYNLCDYEIRGKRGFMTGKMIYQWGVNGETFKTDRIGVNKATFAAYKSFVGGEVSKGRSKMLYYALGACVLAFCMGVYVIAYGLPATFTKAGSSGEKKKAQAVTAPARRDVKKPPKPVIPTDPFLDQVKQLSFAGVLGGRVLVQDVGSLIVSPLSDFMDYKLVECDGASALVMTKEKGLLRIRVRPARYIASAKIKADVRAAEPPAQARASQ